MYRWSVRRVDAIEKPLVTRRWYSGFSNHRCSSRKIVSLGPSRVVTICDPSDAYGAAARTTYLPAIRPNGNCRSTRDAVIAARTLTRRATAIEPSGSRNAMTPRTKYSAAIAKIARSIPNAGRRTNVAANEPHIAPDVLTSVSQPAALVSRAVLRLST